MYLLIVGADLANLVNAAAIYAAAEGDQSVTTRHLEFARDKILMGRFSWQQKFSGSPNEQFFYVSISARAYLRTYHEETKGKFSWENDMPFFGKN